MWISQLVAFDMKIVKTKVDSISDDSRCSSSRYRSTGSRCELKNEMR